MKNEISVHVHVGMLNCSINERDEVLKLNKKIPGFKFCKRLTQCPESLQRIDPKAACLFQEYTDMDIFCHKITGNLLKIFSQRRNKCSPISPLFLTFDSPCFGPISCEEVFPVRDHFLKKHNLHLLPAELFLIVAIHAPEGTGIHDIVTKSIIAGERGGPYRRVGETRLLDRISSPKGVAVADLAKEVWTGFGVRLGVDFCVIEVLFRLAQVKGMPTTFEELAVYDWSQVYGTYFALHQPSDVLKKRIEYKKMLDLAIWILQEFMETRHGIPPSEFYRDYVQDHPLLSDLIRDALAQYRWCPDYQG